MIKDVVRGFGIHGLWPNCQGNEISNTTQPYYCNNDKFEINEVKVGYNTTLSIQKHKIIVISRHTTLEQRCYDVVLTY